MDGTAEILTNPEALLSPEVLEIIKNFAKEHKNYYVAFDPSNPDEHYYSCTHFSRDLLILLEGKIDYKINFIIIATKETKKLFGELNIFPDKSIHCALVVQDLGIVIEPQNGKIFFLDNSKPNNSQDYYSKALGKEPEELAFMITPDENVKRSDFKA